MFKPGAELGRLENNPARDDLEEIGRLIGVDMIVNVVLNADKKVVKAVAGNPVAAHCTAVAFAKQVFGVQIEKSDIVVVSPGGFPKDINVYQAQKALTPAMHATKPGGIIVLAAQCRDGSGDESFEQEMSRYRDPNELITAFLQNDFTIGPHKAYLWAKTLAQFKTILVSDTIAPSLAKKLMVDLRRTLQEAIGAALALSPVAAKVLVLPNANSVVPIISSY